MASHIGLYWNKRSLVMIFGDLFCFLISYLFALYIRFDFSFSNAIANIDTNHIFIVIFLQFVVYLLFGAYVGMWRYTSIHSILSLCSAVVISFLLNLFILIYLWGHNFSRGVLLIDALLVIITTSSLRIFVRLIYEHVQKNKNVINITSSSSIKKRKVIILGAGNAGELIIREMLKSNGSGGIPVAILDDDPRKIGRSIHGVQVVGSIDTLQHVMQRFESEEVFICIPSLKGTTMRRIVEICKDCGVKYKTLPGVNELINQDFSLNSLREVNYNDLLGRETVTLDLERIKGYLTDKVVLVTGCGGSIGSELCRKILPFEPRQILLLDSGEYNLFTIVSELRAVQKLHDCVPLLANLNDKILLNRIFSTYKPHVVFHAAAYKHVPLLEINPWQAIYNNINSTRNIIETACVHNVEGFVLVSTDKAVRPTNVMGASKRVTELMLWANMNQNMRSMAVRFGNVIGSSGSVVPFFMQQIKAGKPLTVTHPDVTRYFMTIGEAAQLIIQAGGMGKGGETFLIKMGSAVRIRDMAADLIRLCGKVPDKDIPIVYTGLRPGEKLYEELITDGENVVPTPHEKLMKLSTNFGDFSEEKRLAFRESLISKLEELTIHADNQDSVMIKKVLKDIVPEYNPQNVDCCVL